jgi:hypothetical protein
VGPITGLDAVEKRKILPLPGLELRSLGRSAGNQSLYRLLIHQNKIEIKVKLDPSVTEKHTRFLTQRAEIVIRFRGKNYSRR